MSFASEAEFTWAPRRSHFDSPRRNRRSSSISVDNIVPNLRDASVFLREKTVGAVAKSSRDAASWLTSLPLVFAERWDTNFDLAEHPLPDTSAMKIARRAKREAVREAVAQHWFTRYFKWPTAAVAFIATVVGPAHFSSRVNAEGDVVARAVVSESVAVEPQEEPTYVRMYSPEWQESRARLQGAYAERRAQLHPPVEVPIAVSAKQDLGPVQVTSFFGEDSYDSYQMPR